MLLNNDNDLTSLHYRIHHSRRQVGEGPGVVGEIYISPLFEIQARRIELQINIALRAWSVRSCTKKSS